MLRPASIGALLLAVAATGLAVAPVLAAEECPTATSAGQGFVVERGGGSQTEVVRDGQVVRGILRSGGTALLETTMFEGMFEIDRVDRGRRVTSGPKTDLAKLFPLKAGQSLKAEFESRDGSGGAIIRTVVLTVTQPDELYIGACKYQVLKVDRSESRGDGEPRYINTDYYAPDLKWIIAKEWKGRDGRTSFNKFDRISSNKRSD